jgi:hypothetical protein
MKCNKPVTKRVTLYDSTLMRYLKLWNSQTGRRRCCQAWGREGEGEYDVMDIMGTEFCFAR